MHVTHDPKTNTSKAELNRSMFEAVNYAYYGNRTLAEEVGELTVPCNNMTITGALWEVYHFIISCIGGNGFKHGFKLDQFIFPIAEEPKNNLPN